MACVYFCLRPKTKDLGITRIVLVVFFLSLPYQLPPPCYPQFLYFYYLNILFYHSLFFIASLIINVYLPLYLFQPTLVYLAKSITLSTYHSIIHVYQPMSLYLPILPTFPTYPPYIPYLPTSIYLCHLPTPTKLHQCTYVYLPTHVHLPSTTYLPLPILKYQIIIAADPGVGIGLVLVRFFV